MATATTNNVSVSSPCSRTGSPCPSRSKSWALRPRSSESTRLTVRLWQSVAAAHRFDDSYRYLLHDRDSIFANCLDLSIEALGLRVLCWVDCITNTPCWMAQRDRVFADNSGLPPRAACAALAGFTDSSPSQSPSNVSAAGQGLEDS